MITKELLSLKIAGGMSWTFALMLNCYDKSQMKDHVRISCVLELWCQGINSAQEGDLTNLISEGRLHLNDKFKERQSMSMFTRKCTLIRRLILDSTVTRLL